MEPHSLVLTSASTLETSHHHSIVHNRRIAQPLPVLPPQARRPLQNLAQHLARSLRQLGQRLRAGRDARRASIVRVEQPIPAEAPEDAGSCSQLQPQPQPQRLRGWGARRRARAAAARAAAAAAATGAADAPSASAVGAGAAYALHSNQPHSPHHHAAPSQLHHFHVPRHVVHAQQPHEAAGAASSSGRYGTQVEPAAGATSTTAIAASATAYQQHQQQHQQQDQQQDQQHRRLLLEEARHCAEVVTEPPPAAHSAAAASIISTDTSARISSSSGSSSSQDLLTTTAAAGDVAAVGHAAGMEAAVVRRRRGPLRQLGRALRFVNSHLGPKGPGENDKTAVERLLNVATCGMFFQAGSRIVRCCRTAAARRFGWAFCAVGVVATVYHASWGRRFRPAARKVDYWSIAVSSMLLRGVLVGRLPAAVAALMAAVIPFKPSLVSTANFMAVEVRYMLLALSCPALLPAWAAHTGMSLTATACFSLEDTPLLSWFPYTHATFHALSAAAFLTLPGAMNTILESSPVAA